MTFKRDFKQLSEPVERYERKAGGKDADVDRREYKWIVQNGRIKVIVRS